MKKIVIVSRLLKYGAVFLCVMLPLLEALFWMTDGCPFLSSPFFKVDPLPVFGDIAVGWGDLNQTQKILGFLANLLPLSFSMAALGYLAKLFGAFERLVLFEKENAGILKKAGWALVWGQAMYLVYGVCISLILTCRNPVGHRNISISIGNHQFVMLTIGLTILLVSWILEEAAKMHEEQAATI